MKVSEIFSFIFHFPVLFLCTDHYSNITLTLLVILMAIGNTRHFSWNYQSLSNLTVACFFEEIKALHALLWDQQFSRNWAKKWAPTDTTVGAYFSTIVQEFLIFKKLLAIITSMQNHPRSRILNQKINTNNKWPMLLPQLVL